MSQKEQSRKDRHASICLMRAAGAGDCEKILHWHSLGGDPNYCNRNGTTPMMLAASRHHHLAVCLLLNLGAEFSTQDIHGMNVDDYARGRNIKKKIDSLSPREITSLLAGAIICQTSNKKAGKKPAILLKKIKHL